VDLTRITRKPVYIDLGALLEGADPGVISSAAVALIPPRTDPDASTVWTTVTYANPTANFVIAGPDAGGSGAVVAAGTSDLWVRATAPTWVDAALVERVNVLEGGPLATLPAATLSDTYVAGLVTGATGTRDALDARFVNEGQGAGGALAGTYPSPGLNETTVDSIVAGKVGDAASSTTAALSGAYGRRDLLLHDTATMKSPAPPKVMASPPTITTGTSFGNTTISGAKFIHLSTYLTSDAAIGATSLSLRSKIGTGGYTLGSGTNAEPVTVTAVSGSANPYTATLSTPLTKAHTSGTTGDILATTAVRFDGAARRGHSVSGNAPSDFSYQYGAVTGTGGGITQGVQILDFVTDAPLIGFDCFAGGTLGLVMVDGELARATPYQSPAANGQREWTHIDFGGVRQARRITIVGAGQIARIAVDAFATVTAGPTPPGPRIGVLADSYGQQPSSLAVSGGPFLAAMIRLGWFKVALSAVGGTGYLNNNTTWTTFRQRVAADVLGYAPDVVYVAGGLNDQGRQTKAVLQAEALALFQQIRAALPLAWIVADSVWTPNGTNASSANYIDVRDAVRNALAAVTGPWLFIDNLTGGWTASDGRTSPGSGQFQTGAGKGPVGPPSIAVQSTAGSGGTFAAGTYYYKATATTASGESTGSDEVSATVALNGTVTIASSGQAGATGLKLYRGTTPGGQATLVGSFSVGGTITDTGAGSAGTVPGTDTTAAVTGDGNADFYIADGTHPNRPGNAFLAHTRAEILAAVLRNPA
jgi:lysophospholipase L1-like esterase